VQHVLDGALEQLNAAKLHDALRARLPAASLQRMAQLAHAVLLASSMLERCERCCNAAISAASEQIALRLSVQKARQS
jgi:hypothetical protein